MQLKQMFWSPAVKHQLKPPVNVMLFHLLHVLSALMNAVIEDRSRLLILLRSGIFKSAALPLAVAVKKPLREWGDWLLFLCLLINDLLLELATNLWRSGGGSEIKKVVAGTGKAMDGRVADANI